MKTLIELYNTFFPVYPFIIFGCILVLLLVLTIRFSLENKQYTHKFKWFWIGSGLFFGSFVYITFCKEITTLFLESILPTVFLYVLLPVGLIYNVFKTNDSLNS